MFWKTLLQSPYSWMPSGSPCRIDHAPAVARHAAVDRGRRFAVLLVAGPVSGAQGLGQPRHFTPLPEILLEDLALVRLGQLDEEVRLLGQDDRRDVVLEPLAFVLGKRLDLFGLLLLGELREVLRRRGLGRRCRGRNGRGSARGRDRCRSRRGIGSVAHGGARGDRPGARERGREDEKRESSRLHRTTDLNSRLRYGYSLKKVLRRPSDKGDNLKFASGNLNA